MRTMTNVSHSPHALNWYTKEYEYFAMWVENARLGPITSINLLSLIDAYLMRLTELGCDIAAVNILKTALYNYCALCASDDAFIHTDLRDDSESVYGLADSGG